LLLATINIKRNMDEVGQKPAMWKHIGLYGHAVGTFTGKK
jgi:hypothetical protein